MSIDKKSAMKFTDILSWYIYQPMAYALLKLIIDTKITPNQVTIVSMLFGLLSAIFIIFNQYIFAVLFLHISFILDCLDGQLARAKNQQSQFGLWLDNVFDRLVENLILIALITVNQEYALLGMGLVFLNMFHAYISDLVIYREMHLKRIYKKLSIMEKILFSPIYLLNRSFVILFLSISFFYPLEIVSLLMALYSIGILFQFYKEVKNR